MMLSAAAKHLAKSRNATAAAAGAVRTMAGAPVEQFEDYGKSVFTGKVADTYLSKHGASGDILKDPTWVKTHADTVANAVFEWYVFSNVPLHSLLFYGDSSEKAAARSPAAY